LLVATSKSNVKSFLDAIRSWNFTLNKITRIASQRKIQILRYVVGNSIVEPEREWMRALKEFPHPSSYKSLQGVLEMFAHCAKCGLAIVLMTMFGCWQ